MNNKRQIKFRAWIPDEDEHGKMHSLPFSDGEHIERLNENGTIEICRYNDYIVKVAGLDDENISEGFQTCEATILQFTGVKDKDGNEIFEGDILGPKGGKIIGNLSPDKLLSDYLRDNPDFVVIGNIYDRCIEKI